MACPCSVPSHYQNQSWLLVNWTHRNTFHGNLNKNTKIIFQGNAFQNVVCKICAILSRPQCHDFVPFTSFVLCCYIIKLPFSGVNSFITSSIWRFGGFKIRECLIWLYWLFVRHCQLSEKNRRERLSLSAFLGTEDIAVHIVHISCLIITFTLE